MTGNASIAAERLRRQRITSSGLRRPADVVAWFGAVQAQEYGPAKWGLAQRISPTPDRDRVEDALTRGDILRTHVLRPTWHFVTPADIRWMLALTGPRIQRTVASYLRKYGLDRPVVTRALRVMERALHGRTLTRPELGTELARKGIAARGITLGFLTLTAELEGIVCSGPHRESRPTYALLDERVPSTPERSRDESVGELVRRFFQSHGPATTRDFAWWSGLTMADARRGLEIVGGKSVDIDGLTYWTVGRAPAVAPRATRVQLLPIYDEFIVAYRDRAAVPHGSERLTPLAMGMTFQHALVIDGQIAGTWRIERARATTIARVIPLRVLTRAEDAGIARAVKAFERFSA